MTKHTISIDAMGGDNAPKAILKGINYFCKTYPFIDQVHFLIYGKKHQLQKILRNKRKYQNIIGHYEIVDVPDVVDSYARPSEVIKKSTDTSMWQAIKAVKDKKADAVVSCGNTGCYMAFSKLQLRMLENIKRPALTTLLPTREGNTVMLDLGANLDHTAESLIDYAIMGSIYSSIVNNISRPTVGLLNIGEEDTKGNESIRKANEKLKKIDTSIFKYHGFVEGNDITLGTTDVVVTDGWTGNIAMKSIEGTARFISYLIKNAFKGKTLWSKFWGAVAYLLIRKSMNKIVTKVDARRYNGAIFAGLNGIVIKSHGGSDYMSFYYAIHYALNFTQHQFNEKIQTALHDYYKKNPKGILSDLF
ncbi:MAG: phosphate acyltransferase PlsX [Rickettsiales bacterium]|jgi:glycerol-3-phosphate acyltransferase PlsX|nr:phosphate acyltransferase PlsX [Rickettsiales bacterium]